MLALEVAEEQGTISKLGESGSRLVICSALLGVLVFSARRLERSIRVAVTLCAIFVGAELCFEVLEDIRGIDAVMSRTWKHGIEKFIVACWTCSGFYLIYTLVSELDKSNEKLRKRDVEMQAANHELSHALDRLKDAQAKTIELERMNALGRMASGVAHDLNNALAPVESLSRALLDEKIEFDHGTIELIHLGAEHSMNVVKNLQHFYRPLDTTKHEVIDVADIARRTVELTRLRWSNTEARRGVKFEMVTELAPNCHVRGNSTELVQLVTNLVMNSIESMDDGGRIVIGVTRAQDGVVLSVADQGCGMSQEELERCFEPFFSQKAEGTGLGLSLCHGIARRHRASITVDSPDPVGSRFVVKFPAVQRLDRTPTSNQRELVSLDGKKILCIDDNEWVRRGTKVLFSTTGAELHTASNGASGLELLEANEFDLLVTDLGMKEMSGREVVARVKRRFPRLPVAVVSGWCRDQVLEEFMDCPKPDFVLEKPLNVTAVRDCLTRASM